ncbi:hypothetical protein ScPMuIL_005071 [Solemya velum]
MSETHPPGGDSTELYSDSGQVKDLEKIITSIPLNTPDNDIISLLKRYLSYSNINPNERKPITGVKHKANAFVKHFSDVSDDSYCNITASSRWDYIRLLMAQPLLLVELLVCAFAHLVERASTDAFKKVVVYNRETWIEGVLPVGSWTVFMVSIRTNNDCERWLRRLDTNARDGILPFYTLVPELSREAGRKKTRDV